jgi:hypothetical protein
MKMLPAVLALSLLIGGSSAWSATAQQEKMKTCNVDATTKALKGPDRQAFMKTCLSKEGGSASSLTPQQEKMKTCNKDATAKQLKGQERKTFMSACLKG